MNTVTARSNEFAHRIKRIFIRLFLPTPTSLISPVFDILMAGGLSVIMFLALFLFVPKDENIFTWAIAFYYVAFIVNYSHFASSYLLMYGESRSGFFTYRTNRNFTMKMWWAGVVVPLILLAYIYYAFRSQSAAEIGYLAAAMYFFVGWHYVKQIYGCVIVLSTAKKVLYTKYERWAILAPLYGLWALSFVNANMSGVTGFYYQIPYSSLSIPLYVRELCYVWVLVSTILLCVTLVRKYFVERASPPFAALVAIASIYLWYLPLFAHPFYFYAIPFLHSMQYLLFVIAHNRNSVKNSVTSISERLTMNAFSVFVYLCTPILIVLLAFTFKYEKTVDIFLAEYLGKYIRTDSLLTLGSTLLILALIATLLWFLLRRKAVGKFIYTIFSSLILGATFFALIPLIFDSANGMGALPDPLSYPQGILGASLYLFVFTVFINIHHYFIDNVIWKRDNPYMRNKLLPKELPRS